MDVMGGISSILSIVTFAIFAAGLMKVIEMTKTLSEIKDVLTAIKLNAPVQQAARPAMAPAIATPVAAPAPLPSTMSGEEMLRAALSELEHPIEPASIELGNKS